MKNILDIKISKFNGKDAVKNEFTRIKMELGDLHGLRAFIPEIKITGAEMDSIEQGELTAIYVGDYFVTIEIEGARLRRAERFALSVIQDGYVILNGRDFEIGSSPPGYPQLIVDKIGEIRNFPDTEGLYVNTLLFVRENPDYVWLEKDHV